MTTMAKFKSIPIRTLPAFLALSVGSHAALAATTVTIKNSGPTPVQIGFDGGQAKTIASRDTARFSLDMGEHSIQCRFEGNYDGCNIENRFTVATNRDINFSLQPAFTLQHAVAMAQQGTLRLETRQDAAWATNTLEVPGTAPDCADYSAGKLAAVSRQVRSGVTMRDATVATQNLCGQQATVVGAVVNGTQLYFQPRFVTFRDTLGRPILVKP